MGPIGPIGHANLYNKLIFSVLYLVFDKTKRRNEFRTKYIEYFSFCRKHLQILKIFNFHSVNLYLFRFYACASRHLAQCSLGGVT